jgi:hypothetical protein
MLFAGEGDGEHRQSSIFVDVWFQRLKAVCLVGRLLCSSA